MLARARRSGSRRSSIFTASRSWRAPRNTSGCARIMASASGANTGWRRALAVSSTTRMTTATMADRPPPNTEFTPSSLIFGGGRLFPQRRTLAMPTEQPAPIAHHGDDDTQDDWAADLFAALDEQSEADEPDDDSSAIDTLLPPDAQRAPF